VFSFNNHNRVVLVYAVVSWHKIMMDIAGFLPFVG
jgi:hypothetical protein